jgi:hypothetical protein
MQEREWDPNELRRAMDASRLEYEASQKRLHDQHMATQRQLELSLKETAAAAPKLKKAIKPKPPAGNKARDPFARKGAKAEHAKRDGGERDAEVPAGSKSAAAATVPTAQQLDPDKKAKLGSLKELPRLRLQRSVEAASAAQWVCESIGSDEPPAAGAAAAAAAPDCQPSVRTVVVGEAERRGAPVYVATATAGHADTPVEDERRRYFLEQRDKLRVQRKEERDRSLQAFADNSNGGMTRLDRPTDEVLQPSKRRSSGTVDQGRPAGELFRQALSTRLTQEVVRGGNIRSERGTR